MTLFSSLGLCVKIYTNICCSNIERWMVIWILKYVHLMMANNNTPKIAKVLLAWFICVFMFSSLVCLYEGVLVYVSVGTL